MDEVFLTYLSLSIDATASGRPSRTVFIISLTGSALGSLSGVHPKLKGSFVVADGAKAGAGNWEVQQAEVCREASREA